MVAVHALELRKDAEDGLDHQRLGAHSRAQLLQRRHDQRLQVIPFEQALGQLLYEINHFT